MVVKIKTGKNVHGALNYNEKKVEEGKVECIGANGFLKEVNELNFYEKLDVFMNLNERNTRTKTNTLHVSLNFDPSEKHDTTTLNSIASTYMDRIGFGDQPYLVYEHRDTAHPHVHIVSTLIRSDGSRIPTHYVGKNESERARIEIEKEFGLVAAQRKRVSVSESLKQADLTKAAYGRSETKTSIARVVSNVARNYRFTSLAELNAVLRLYNVNADRGGERSQMFLKGGLHYSVANDKGERVGVPIKASALPGKPTLKFLEKLFKANETLRQPMKEPVKRIIDAALSIRSVKTSGEFAHVLNSQNIRVMWRTNDHGRTYGVTFVDQGRKVVFNGSDLGKAYTANAILDKLSAKENAVQEVSRSYSDREDGIQRDRPISNRRGVGQRHDEQSSENATQLSEVLEQLVRADTNSFASPENAMKLRRKGKRKRKRSGNR